MKKQIATDPGYRRVVAALDDCEKRYDSLIKRTGATDDLRLASTVAILKGEVEQRRRLEVELLTAVESERQRIGQDLHAKNSYGFSLLITQPSTTDGIQDTGFLIPTLSLCN